MKREHVFEFFRRLAEANPAPTTELESTNPYQLLVAVVLSAQATDTSVNVAMRPLFERIKTPRQMVDFGEERLQAQRLRQERHDRPPGNGQHKGVGLEPATIRGAEACHAAKGWRRRSSRTIAIWKAPSRK